MIKKILIPILIFIVFLSVFRTHAIDWGSLYLYDEYAWISRGYYLDLLVTGDFKNKLWRTDDVDGDPKLPSYIYGLTIYPDFLKEKRLKGENYDMVQYLIDHNIYRPGFMSKSLRPKYEKYAKNQGTLKWKPDKEDGKTLNDLINEHGEGFKKMIGPIVRARIAAVFFLTLSVVLAYWLAVKIFNNALIASIIAVAYSSTWIVATYGTVAYSEAFFLFFINLSFILIIDLILGSKKRRWLKLVLFGVVLALLNQTKLNGILILIVYGLLSGLYLLKNFKKTLIEFFLVLGVFSLVYLSLNPMLWSNPVKNTIFQYQWTHKVSQRQRMVLSKFNLPNISSRLSFIDKHLFVGPDLFLIPDMSPSTKQNLSYVIRLFFITGFIGFLAGLKKAFRSTKSVFFIISMFLYVVLPFYLTLSWERYLIHLILPTYIIVGQGWLSFVSYIRRSLSVK